VRCPVLETSSLHFTNLLGDGSDLGWGASAEDLFESLKMIWEVALSHKSKVLALTIPESGPEGAQGCTIDIKRQKVNDMIKGYKRENL
jgi:hypothetical protein